MDHGHGWSERRRNDEMHCKQAGSGALAGHGSKSNQRFQEREQESPTNPLVTAMGPTDRLVHGCT
jgi:hypothetical protein